MNATTDRDRDGVSDRDESMADTNPTNPGDHLRITAFRILAGGSAVEITWTSRPTRLYQIQERASLSPAAAWVDSGLGLIVPDPGPTTTRTVPEAASDQRLFRIEAVVPLGP